MSKRTSKRNRAAKRLRLDAKSGAAGTAMPPSKGAPPAVYPIAVNPAPNALAPQPLVDRYPLVIGQQLSASYIASVFRLCTTGYRQQYVDLLNELLEHDPHLFSVVQKRIVSSAVGRVEIIACDLPPDDPEQDDAEDLADFVQSELKRIPNITHAIALLLWALYYGLSALEIFWTRDSDGWHVDRLGFIHSRRLAYPDGQSFSLYVWDQGQVYGWTSPWGSTPSNSGVFGLRIEDYPGKFIVHTPQLRGDYPTRDGIGREVAIWAAFKRIGGRGASEYLERFSKPLMDITFTRGTDEHGRPVPATDEDIALAAQIAAQLGPGSGSYASHADTIKVGLLSHAEGASAKLTWPEWMGFCNAEMSKAALGGTLGTEVGKGGGNRSLGEVQERAETDLEKYDAAGVAETIRRDLVSWIVRLNRPDKMHLLPQVNVHVDSDPDPKAILALAKELTAMGGPVDLDALSNTIGIPLVPQEDGLPPRQAYRSDLANTVLALTKADYPVDLDALSKLTGIPIVALEDMATARRSRIVVGGAQTPVEPEWSNDPNDPNYEPEPPAAADGSPGESGAGDGTTPDAPGIPPNRVSVRTHQRGRPAPKPKPTAVDGPAKDAPPDATAQINAALRGALLLSDRSDRDEAQDVFDQLAEDYPEETLGWVLAAHWEGPMEVPMDQIDFTSRQQWRASHEPLDKYVDHIKSGRRKPVILVKRPNKPKLMIVDGHHRTLASEKLAVPVRAYVATVRTEVGPWDTLHNEQSKGSSKGSTSWLESMQKIRDASYSN